MFVSFHISNTDSRLLLPTMVDCTCAFYPPATLQVLPLVRAAPANLTFVCSSQRVLPIEELQLSDADDGDDEDPSDAVVDFSDYFNNGDGMVGFDDSLSEEVLKERIRRMRIGLANRGKVRKKMAEHPHSHSDQTKAKISDSVRRVWHERLKSKRIRDGVLLSWTQRIANVAKKGGIGQEELEWDSYHKIRQQLELHHHMLASKKRREKVMAVTGAKNIILTWRENIARAAKKGGSGEQELDWDSYEKIQEEIIRQRQFQRTEEKAKKKELARVKSEKAARIKAIKRVILTQKRKEHQERAKVKGNIKSHRHRNTKEGKASLEDTQELKLCNPLTKIHLIENTNGDLTREGDTFDCIFPVHNKLDLELIKREKMQKEVSLADQIQAARDKKSKLHT
ncbi:hypothetical protein V8G54_025303 [Vigna mungo]|uniref:Uncharacterized protein n=1 Tax=Vigna mungo TaxID=3915 RepID=A0AAQ3N7T0_VIGMU